MRRFAVSLVACWAVGSAFASARLPVVNIASGSVSAREAFGQVEQPKTVRNNAQTSQGQKKLVARNAKKTSVKSKTTESGSGHKTIAQNDVLSPRKPSADLWAKTDTPLRMPSVDEFAVYRSEAVLPEENIDAKSPSVQKSELVARANVEPLSQLDAQIELLNKMQKRADKSFEKNQNVVAQQAEVKDVVEEEPLKIAAVQEKDNIENTVSVRRVVVPEKQTGVVQRSVVKASSPRIAATREDMTKLSPTELRKAFRKTFLSENKHLSTYSMDDRFDEVSDMSVSAEGFTARRDLSESDEIRPLEIKIKFRNDDAALSRDNYNLLAQYASIVMTNPTRAIQVSIPESITRTSDGRKLAARRLAIVEQVLRDTGVSEQRIMPVLSQRDETGFVLRMISGDQYETLSQKKRDMFGDTVSKKTYKSMSW